MKPYFFMCMFIFSAFISQTVCASNFGPQTLEEVVQNVKNMRQQGVSKEDIAAYINQTVANRLTFLNHMSKRVDSVMERDPQLDKNLERFNAWVYKNDRVNDGFSSATWAWENRMGQCDQATNIVAHVLIMAYESTDEVTTLSNGAHRFVIFGNIKDLPVAYSSDDLRSLDGAYIIDAWDNASFLTKNLSLYDWHQYGNGTVTSPQIYRKYKEEYDKWDKWRKENHGNYLEWLYGPHDHDTVELAGCWLLKDQKGSEHAKINVKKISDEYYLATLTDRGWLGYDLGHVLFVVRRSNGNTFDGTERATVGKRTYETTLMITVDFDRSGATYRTKDDVVTLVPCSGAN